jgi:hypothetical protein
MLGELFAGVEAEHGDIHPVAPVYDLGDNGTGLDGHFADGIGDQGMGHSGIIVLRAERREFLGRGHRRGDTVSRGDPLDRLPQLARIGALPVSLQQHPGCGRQGDRGAGQPGWAAVRRAER